MLQIAKKLAGSTGLRAAPAFSCSLARAYSQGELGRMSKAREALRQRADRVDIAGVGELVRTLRCRPLFRLGIDPSGDLGYDASSTDGHRYQAVMPQLSAQRYVLALLFILPLLPCSFTPVVDGLKYAKSHEWVKSEGDTATLGISDFAQARASVCCCCCPM